MHPLFRLFFIICLALLLGWSANSVQAVSCSSQLARWNLDATDPSDSTLLEPLFSCQWISASQNITADSLTNIKPSGLGRDACKVSDCDGDQPAGQICACARQPDCSTIGGVCLRNGVVFADAALPNGTARPDGYIVNVPFRCPGDSNISCFIKADQSLSSAQDPLITPEVESTETAGETSSEGGVAPTTATDVVQEDPQEVRPFSNCCREIVPKDGQSYEQGAYGLNHFVQIGINVYECILCMVAALMLLMFVLGSFYLLTSAGQPAKVGKGIGIIRSAVVGGLIVFASILIVNFSVKALGGSFLDSPMIKINPDGGPKTSPTYGPPAPATTGLGAPTSSTTTTPSGSGPTASSTPGIKFSNCNPQQQKKYNEAVSAAWALTLNDLGHIQRYLEGAFKEVNCASRPGVDAAYNFTGSICPSAVEVYDSFFVQNKIMSLSTLIHEARHHYDCVNSKFTDNCADEQRAFSLEADYLEWIGEFTQAHHSRCEWPDGGGYVDENGDKCVVNDPKC